MGRLRLRLKKLCTKTDDYSKGVLRRSKQVRQYAENGTLQETGGTLTKGTY
jgi:hypothetical protein